MTYAELDSKITQVIHARGSMMLGELAREIGAEPGPVFCACKGLREAGVVRMWNEGNGWRVFVEVGAAKNILTTPLPKPKFATKETWNTF